LIYIKAKASQGKMVSPCKAFFATRKGLVVQKCESQCTLQRKPKKILIKMKKIIYGGLFLTLVGITIMSCQKEQLPKIKESSTSQAIVFDERYRVAVDKEILIFESSGAFDTVVSSNDSNFVANFIATLNNLGLKSYQSKLNNDPKLRDELVMIF
jgi:hypothetical protein